MTDIHHKAPDTRKSRWWRMPTPTKEYKEGYDRIFKKPDRGADQAAPTNEGSDNGHEHDRNS